MNEEKELTPVQLIVNHYFNSLGLDLDEIKEQAKSGKINYGRHTRDAKQLLALTDNDIEKAKEAIDTVAEWADERAFSYTIGTILKKWLELCQ